MTESIRNMKPIVVSQRRRMFRGKTGQEFEKMVAEIAQKSQGVRPSADVESEVSEIVRCLAGAKAVLVRQKEKGQTQCP